MQLALTAADGKQLGIHAPFFEAIVGLANNFILIMGHRLLAEKTGLTKNTIRPKLLFLIELGFVEVTQTPNKRTRIRFRRGVEIGTVGTLSGSKIGTRSFTVTKISKVTSLQEHAVLDAYNRHITDQRGFHLPRVRMEYLSLKDRKNLKRRAMKSDDPAYWDRVFSGLSRDDWAMGRAVGKGELLKAAREKRSPVPFRLSFRGFISPKNDWLISLGLKAHEQNCGTLAGAPESDPNQLSFDEAPTPVASQSLHNVSSATHGVEASPASIGDTRHNPENQESRFSGNNLDSDFSAPITPTQRQKTFRQGAWEKAIAGKGSPPPPPPKIQPSSNHVSPTPSEIEERRVKLIREAQEMARNDAEKASGGPGGTRGNSRLLPSAERLQLAARAENQARVTSESETALVAFLAQMAGG